MPDLVQTLVARLDVDAAAWNRGLQQAAAQMDRAAAEAERAGNRMTASERRRAQQSRQTSRETTRQAAEQEAATRRATTATTRQAAEQEAATRRTARAATEAGASATRQATQQEGAARRTARAATQAGSATVQAAVEQETSAQRAARAATAGAQAQVTAGRTASRIAQETATTTAATATRAAASNRAIEQSLERVAAAQTAATTSTTRTATTTASASSTQVRSAAQVSAALGQESAAYGRTAAAAQAAAASQVRSAAQIRAAIQGPRVATMSASQISSAIGGLNAASATATASAGRVRSAFSSTWSTVASGAANATAGVRNLAGQMTSLSPSRLAGLTTLSSTMTKTGAVFAATAGLGVAAAMQWESAWTGVKKTVSGTPEQMDALESSLRGLAKTLPNSHQEIAGIAQAAGQLGIKTPEIAAFTDTMARLATSTNMTAEDGATEMARFMNVMDEAPDSVNRLGATLVGLGNNYAATESEIMEMSQRLAGAGKQAGLSSAEVMGLSTSMAAVGINAEAGGTAMSTILKKVNNAVMDGGDKLTAFSDTADMSAKDFAAAWKSDPAAVLDSLVKGLKRTATEGGNVNSVLADMGIKNIRESDAMLRLSNSAQGVGNAMRDANQFFAENTALMKESDMFNGTAANRLKIAWNTMKDGAIDMGAATLPVVANIATAIGNIGKSFSQLPRGVQTGIGGFTIFAAGTTLAIGAAGKMIVSLNNMRTAFSSLRGAGGTLGRTASLLGTIGKAALPIAGTAAAIVAVANAFTAKASANAEDMVNAILNLQNQGDASGLNGIFANWDTMFTKKTSEITDLNGAVELLANPPSGQAMNTWADKTFGWTGLAKSETTQVTDRFKELGTSLGQMVQGGQGEAAAKTFTEISDAFKEQGMSAEDALNYLPGYKEALQQQAQASGNALEGTDLLNAAMKGTAGSSSTAATAVADQAEATEKEQAAAQEAAQAENDHAASMGQLSYDSDGAARSLNDVYEAMTKVANAALASEDAELSYYDAVRQADKAQKDNAVGLNAKTEAGSKNRREMMNLAQRTIEFATATDDATESQQRMAAGRKELVDYYMSKDPIWQSSNKSAKALEQAQARAEAYADSLHLVPDEVYVAFDSNAPDMEGTLTEIYDMVKNAPDGTIEINEDDESVIRALEDLGFKVTHLKNGNIKVEADAKTLKKAKGDIEEVASAKYQAKVEAEAEVKEATGSAKKAAEAIAKGIAAQKPTAEIQAKIDKGKVGKDLGAAIMNAPTPTATVKSKSDGKAGKELDAAAKKPRTSTVTGKAATAKADSDLNKTAKKPRTSTISAKAAVDKAASALTAVAKKTRTAKVGTKADTNPAESAINHMVNTGRVANIGTLADTGPAATALAGLTGNQGTALISVALSGVGAAMAQIASVARSAAHAAKVGKKDGGRVGLPKRAGGGRLPATGLGTDQILGVSRKDGTPTAWVDDREWVINRRSSDAFDGTLSAINRGDRTAALASLVRGHADGGVVGGGLPGFASGGRYQWASRTAVAWNTRVKSDAARLSKQKAEQKAAEKAEAAAEKRLDKAKSKAAKARAKAALQAAKHRVNVEEKQTSAAQKRLDDAREARTAARERKSRLSELEFSTRRDLYRGTMRGDYGAGNYSGVDALFELSNNTDLSAYRRKTTRALAYKQEKQVKSLTKQYESLTTQLDAARSKRDDLLQVKNQAKDSIVGTLDFTSLTGQRDQWGYNQYVGKKGVLAYAKKIQAGAKKLSATIDKLRKLGFPESMLQQVIDEWTNNQTFELADALLSMNKSERSTLTRSMSLTEKYAGWTGSHVTESMYKGGVAAADGLAKGLYARQKKVEKAFTTLAKQGEAAFKKALGIHSPSRVMAANGGHVVSGLTVGIEAQAPMAVTAMSDLGRAQSQAYTAAVSAPRYTMPASAEVAKYAASQGQSPVIDYDALAAAMARVNITSPVYVDRNTAARLVQVGGRQAARLQ